MDWNKVDEYTSSMYTRKLKGGLVKAKANMVQGVPEMIEIATDKRWNEDFNQKHGKRAEHGWYRYNSRFAMPVLDEDGDKDDFWHMGLNTLVKTNADSNKIAGGPKMPHCSEAWDAISRYIYTGLQGGSNEL